MSWLERVIEINGEAWRPVGTAAFVSSSALVALAAYLANSGERWVYILDSANLVFHEAGHPLFGLLLGSRMAVYGGTLGQLVFPAVAIAVSWQRRESVAFALSAAWLFENFWNIARYMADAREQMLPLVGGGEHDWTEIFTRWHMLQRDTSVAGLVSVLAWLGILATWSWLAWHWWRDRNL